MTTENGNAIIDASCYVNGQKIGEFPYGRQLRAVYGNREHNCKIASHQIVDDKHEVYIDIDLPFVIDNKLPLVTNLVGVTFENRQAHIAASVVGDMLSIVHTPTDEYPCSEISFWDKKTLEHKKTVNVPLRLSGQAYIESDFLYIASRNISGIDKIALNGLV